MKGWVDQVGWPIAVSLRTPVTIDRAEGRNVCRPMTDVLTTESPLPSSSLIASSFFLDFNVAIYRCTQRLAVRRTRLRRTAGWSTIRTTLFPAPPSASDVTPPVTLGRPRVWRTIRGLSRALPASTARRRSPLRLVCVSADFENYNEKLERKKVEVWCLKRREFGNEFFFEMKKSAIIKKSVRCSLY